MKLRDCDLNIFVQYGNSYDCNRCDCPLTREEVNVNIGVRVDRVVCGSCGNDLREERRAYEDSQRC